MASEIEKSQLCVDKIAGISECHKFNSGAKTLKGMRQGYIYIGKALKSILGNHDDTWGCFVSYYWR